MSIQLPQTCMPALCEIAPGVLFQWHHGQRAYRIKLRNSHRATIDAFVETNLLAVQGWSLYQPWLSFQDVSEPDVVVTPYMRSRMEAVFNIITKLGYEGYVVLLVANNSQGCIHHGFIRATAGETARIRRYIFNRPYRADEKFYQLLQQASMQVTV